ncbi:cache domain-containing sensor histidine kinase [Paenibacillus mucilaginosus]|uniref:histidine kinase n=2 Tax=Paenibacillus mucilaginosus TaxID=61624 RepID=I0BP21_9BACL|nr:sensor histidine kinase [Paenibacillus mucilaginosus]AEI44217.1 integral membrane sensor signal transduction histidine kinase [Paenibacillus mucilaginosus KNP414]AFH64118.2 histidine kinase [Paenibacillus mucilaginosus K02]MCG7216629.1 sensor histidine kinase [Paenibacillus mucilaginosus]WDM25626.1 sensor histidine kinase [Paenibacillus mucilaginosus]
MTVVRELRERLRDLQARIAYKAGGISLQTRLIASYIVIILIPILLLSVYTFNVFYENKIRDIVKTNESILEIEAVNIRSQMETMERTAELVDSDKKVKEFLQSPRELEVSELIDYRTGAYDNLLRLQFNNPNIAHIRLFSGNPNVKEIWPVFHNESRIKGEPWYELVLKNAGQVTWVFEESDRDYIRHMGADNLAAHGKVSLLRVLSPNQASHAGIVQVDMLFEQIFPKTFSSVPDSQSQMLVLDGLGRLHTKKDIPFLEGLDQAELVRELRGRSGEKSGSFEFRSGDKPYLAVFLDLDRLQAKMVNVVSLTEPLTELRGTRNRIILANIALIALLSVTTYFLLSLILKKLHVLQDSMKKVRQGNFHFDVNIHGGGEVGELAHHFRLMLRKINELIADAVNKQAATKEAELHSLKNQIDAHFLYNTLENLKMLAEIEGQYTISDSLTSLGGMMRYNLKWTSDYVRLADELQHIGNYIAIMNVRYDGKLRLELDIPPDYLEQKVPKMSLQPVVENAVKHGMGSSCAEDGGTLVIRVQAEKREGCMILRIRDNGVGMNEEQLQALTRTLPMEDREFYRFRQGAGRPESEGSGIGLRNVNQRVRLYSGPDYGIAVDSREGAYTEVVVKLPFQLLTGGG